MGCGTITRLAEASGIQVGKNVLEDVSDNFEGAGVHIKLTPLKEGLKVIQHKHKYAHLSLLLSGKVVVETDGYVRLVDATVKPQSLVIEADTYHAVTALTDSVWLCVHSHSDEVK